MVHIPVAILPVLVFLAVLVFVDSFKLVPLRSVLLAILAGCVAALICSSLNGALIDALGLSSRAFSRYVAPVTEELFKALYLAYLIRKRRVGFLVDAAIQGFAIGAGFAMVENTYYLLRPGDAGPLLWIVRGLGTALVHGSTTSTFGMISQGLAERHGSRAPWVFAPGVAASIAAHSFFNHFVIHPLLATALLLALFPLLMIVVFERSRDATRAWLAEGFHGDTEFLATILQGEVGDTRVGSYLHSLKSRFPGPVVADMLCLIRVNLELSLQGKGILIAREAGLDLPIGSEVKANLEEMRYLEKAVGATGLLAIRPLLKNRSRDLWHLYMLDQTGASKHEASR